MRTRIVIVLVLCLIGVVAVPKRSADRRSRDNGAGTPFVIPKNVEVAPMMLALDAPGSPFFNVDVDWSLQLSQADQTLYQQMATDLCAVTAVPAARTTFFSGVTGYQMNSWGGMVQNVVTNGDGTHTVTVSVAPILSNGDGSETTASVPDGGYTEQYNIDQKHVATYLSSQDPLGLAGQFIALMID